MAMVVVVVVVVVVDIVVVFSLVTGRPAESDSERAASES
jgi:hypothetical protein